jgi:hypothetical protein
VRHRIRCRGTARAGGAMRRPIRATARPEMWSVPITVVLSAPWVGSRRKVLDRSEGSSLPERFPRVRLGLRTRRRLAARTRRWRERVDSGVEPPRSTSDTRRESSRPPDRSTRSASSRAPPSTTSRRDAPSSPAVHRWPSRSSWHPPRGVAAGSARRARPPMNRFTLRPNFSRPRSFPCRSGLLGGGGPAGYAAIPFPR